MKINPTTTYINQTYTKQAGNDVNLNLKPEKSADEAKADSISFSDRTMDLQKISKAMDTVPADREKYIADIKQSIETNQYNVNAEAVAEKMASTFMNDFG